MLLIHRSRATKWI